MDTANLRAITNHYVDVRLVSLREWKDAKLIQPKDNGGPYVVVQDGYDPQDASASYDEFVLGKSGAWLSVGLFHKLPRESRRQEFVFGTAAEIIALLEDLVCKVKILRPGEPLATPSEGAEPDDLTAAFNDAKDKAAKGGGS